MTHVARVYDARAADEGVRALVDRLWPRGIRKDDPRIDVWWRDLAPTAELRRWFAHRPEAFDEFAARYEAELAAPAAAELLARAREVDSAEGLTLLTATRELAIAHAPVLARVIDGAG